jgi:hypothetical protein
MKYNGHECQVTILKEISTKFQHCRGLSCARFTNDKKAILERSEYLPDVLRVFDSLGIAAPRKNLVPPIVD